MRHIRRSVGFPAGTKPDLLAMVLFGVCSFVPPGVSRIPIRWLRLCARGSRLCEGGSVDPPWKHMKEHRWIGTSTSRR